MYIVARRLLIGIAIATQAAVLAEERRTFRVDPVELNAGREVPGDAAIAADRGGYRYLFANAENKAKFERDPKKYEIQLGGACARMGPLSGACSCDYFTVYDGKLYVFASQQCRDAFLKAPQRLLESDDAPPEGDAAASTRAKDLLELAVTFVGDADKVDGVKTFRYRIEKAGEHQGKPTRETSTFTAAFPERFRYDDTWNDSAWGHAIVGDTGFFVGSDSDRGPMVMDQVKSARRTASRNLLVILKARTRSDFRAAVTGKGQQGGVSLEYVAAAFDGATTTLGIDPATGQVHTIRHTGRGPRATLGLVEKGIVEYRDVGGLKLPWAWRVTFDGDEVGAKTTTLTAMEVDPALDEALFKAAKEE